MTIKVNQTDKDENLIVTSVQTITIYHQQLNFQRHEPHKDQAIYPDLYQMYMTK